VGDLAKRANLDPTQPIPLDKLVSAAQQARSERESGGSGSSSGSSGSDSGRDSGRDRERSSSSSAKPATPAVPGFGAVSTTTPKAAGFDVPLSVDTTIPLEKRYDARVIEYVDNMLKDQDKNKDVYIDNIEWKEGRWSTPPEESDTNKDNRLIRAELCERIARRFGLTAPPGSTTSSGGGGDRSRGGSDNKSGSSDGSNSGEAAKFKQYAESLIRQFDKNKNGMLEKDEWSEMKSEHRAADMNGDGVITVDELTAKLQSYSSGSGNSSTSNSGSRGGSGGSDRKSWYGSKNGSSTTKPTDKKGYRLSSATEKLPKGLPDWFLRNDADADGQIAMVEYASTWTDQMAADFQKYDLNGDGYITPEECLAVDKKK